MDAEQVPVIIGCGETIDRPGDCPGNEAPSREPAQLMADALRLADADAGGGWLDRLGSLDVVNSVSWRYANLPGRVARLLGRRPARLSYGAVGGETSVRFLHEAALRIAEDGCGVAAVCGGEAQAAVTAARRAGTVLRWPEEDPGWAVTRSGDLSHPLAKALGVAQPVTVYPFYENACQATWGQTPEEGREESAALWAAMSEVAAGNPSAWLRRPHAAADIALASPANRPVAWPYTKLMVANPGVNQGAAVLLTSLAQARSAGIPEHKLAFPGLGAAAEEPSDYLQRPRFDQSPAMDAVLAGVRDRFGRFDHLELYSCFPCVPKMAARTLGLDPGAAVTVTGGLTFFGAPLKTTCCMPPARWCAGCAGHPGSGCCMARVASSAAIMPWSWRGSRAVRGKGPCQARRRTPTPAADLAQTSWRPPAARPGWRRIRSSTTSTVRPCRAWSCCVSPPAHGCWPGSHRRMRPPWTC